MVTEMSRDRPSVIDVGSLWLGHNYRLWRIVHTINPGELNDGRPPVTYSTVVGVNHGQFPAPPSASYSGDVIAIYHDPFSECEFVAAGPPGSPGARAHS